MKASDLIDFAKEALADEWGYIWGTHGEMWTQTKQEQLEKTTDPDKESSRKYGKKWIGHHVTDCSGLIYEPCRKKGVPMTHGSNTMYLSYCSSKGKLSNGKRQDGKSLLPGTAMFTYNSKTGRYGHVGLYIGDGLCIEAKGAQYGVVTSTPERWGYWGELKGIEYQKRPDDPDGDIVLRPTLRKGAKGEYVTLLQTKLHNKGYSLGAYGIDGSFGNATEKAVRAFQRDSELTQDGVCGPDTWRALDESPVIPLYTVHIPCLTKSNADALASQYAGSWVTSDN